MRVGRPRARSQRRASFEDLYRREYQTVRRQVLYMERGDTAHVDDLIQETFTRTWRSYSARIPKMDPGQMQALLITIARAA
ncbi:sigma factor [Nocardia wallacei]|uniref:sigma factor n=1 Tax=Nocardia wallacei TaxID=480035 RepID=UPI002453ED61|nr:sigma factor [Nocardia wallacei]